MYKYRRFVCHEAGEMGYDETKMCNTAKSLELLPLIDFPQTALAFQLHLQAFSEPVYASPVHLTTSPDAGLLQEKINKFKPANISSVNLLKDKLNLFSCILNFHLHA